VTDADLFFNIRPAENTLLHLTLRLNGGKEQFPVSGMDSHDGTAMLHKVYFQWNNPCESGFSFLVGKDTVPFGIGFDELMLSPYIAGADFGNSWISFPYGEQGEIFRAWNGSMLPAMIGHPGTDRADPAYQARLSYDLRDILKLEATLFQDPTGRHLHRYGNSYKIDDPGLGSYAVKVTATPFEGLEASVSFINRYNRNRFLEAWMDDSMWRPDINAVISPEENAFGARKNSQAFSAGAVYTIPTTRLTLHAEYMHGWNQFFNRNIKSDNIHFGAKYGFTDRLRLYGQGEWLRMKNKDLGDRSTLWQTTWAVQYDLFAGLTTEAGYRHEWLRNKNAWGWSEKSKANVFYLGTKYVF
jgi:hypothetical protein